MGSKNRVMLPVFSFLCFFIFGFFRGFLFVFSNGWGGTFPNVDFTIGIGVPTNAVENAFFKILRRCPEYGRLKYSYRDRYER